MNNNPSNPSSFKDSRKSGLPVKESNPREHPQKKDTGKELLALQQRIAFLEKELVETKVQLACATTGADYRENASKPISVPTAAPFLRRRNADETERARLARASAQKVLNPGSCSSGINLLASSGSLMSIYRGATLNPNSCASGLDLLCGRQSFSSISGISLSMLFGSIQRRTSGARVSSSRLGRDGDRNNCWLGGRMDSQSSNLNAGWGAFD
jgi:hypothetical protein